MKSLFTKIFGGKNSNYQSHVKQSLKLDPLFAYFLLDASFGDRFLILSFVKDFLEIHPEVKIIAKRSDRDIIRIFLSYKVMSIQVIFIDNDDMRSLSHELNKSVESICPIIWDQMQLCQTNILEPQKFPLNTIRHMHIVRYPYFSDLHITHGVPYATLLRMLLYLPSSTVPRYPDNYSDIDLNEAKKLCFDESVKFNKKIVLFNVINFSNMSLSFSQIELIVQIFENYNIELLLNVAEAQDSTMFKEIVGRRKNSRIVEIKGHLLPLVCQNMLAVIGVVGGAMNIANLFSNAHTCSLHTTGLGTLHYNEDNIYGGLYENIWMMYDRDWKCFTANRIIEDIFIGSPKDLPNKNLENIINEFIKKIEPT